LLELAEKITNKAERLMFKIAAYDGLGRNQEAIDSFRVYKAWTDKQYNEEMRKLTEMNALELEVARAENETSTLQLHHQRVMLIVIVCGLFILAVILSAYIYRRLLQMRQLKKAYDQLEEVTTQKERIESELRIARNIQMSMLPNDFPQRPDFDIYASIDPAREVGGDLYDFFVRDNQLFFCIGDVSGKGVPAALFMMVTKSLFRAYSSDECMPDRIVSQMNHNLSENNHQRMFVTLFIGVLDLSSGLLRYCNAGHEAPVIIRHEVSLLPVNRIFPVGAVRNTPYQTQEVVIEPQTTILLYTDGLNEAFNADKKMFCEKGILDEASRALQSGRISPKELIDGMTQAVHDFVGNTEQSDDLTMLAISLAPTDNIHNL
jgi:sigma-B regulation protein RsbU (phosphoserine phosphatase)